MAFGKLIQIFFFSPDTHLSNQRYTICVRREEGMCGICYRASSVGTDGDADDQASFGLS